MALRRSCFRLMRSKLGFTFVVILVLAFFLLMLNAYTSEGLTDSGADSNGFVDDEGVLHRGRGGGHHHRRHKHGHGGQPGSMAVPVCQIPTLTLENDANRHAYGRLEPLECPGEALFYTHNGKLTLNATVLRGRKLNRCEYRAIEWGSDQFHEETKTYIQREAPFDDIQILHDFFRVSCYLERSAAGGRRRLMAEEEVGRLSEKEREIVDAAERAKGRHLVGSPNAVGAGVGLPDIPNQIVGIQRNEYKHDGPRKEEKTDENKDKSENEIVEEKVDYHMEDGGADEGRYDYPQLDTPSAESPDYDQFVVQVVPPDETVTRAKDNPPGANVEPLNVLIFALDSMSHMCYQRKLPLTYEFIQKELGTVILNGYNIVGDATTAALIPMLTGKREDELPEVRVNHPGSFYVDVLPFVWNKFEQQGYATLYAEDMPQFGTFQLRMNGFEAPPVDHYMRPFWQAANAADLHENSPKFCLGAAPEHRYLLDYMKQFMLRYGARSVPRFAFGFIGELSHADNNPAQHVDEDLVAFLRRLHANGALNNTLLVVMGDHGARYSKVRSTLQGKLEERLPMMSLAFPRAFKAKHPELMANLAKNAHRLTTPFDVHETLLDLLDTRRLAAPVDQAARGISLLKEIPLNRTCEAAGIALHWCTCLQYEDVDVADATVRKVARFLVDSINKMTGDLRHKCELLTEKQIIEAKLVVPNEKVLKFLKTIDPDQRVANFSKIIQLDIVHYQLVVVTAPNSGMYEATVQHTVAKGTLEVVGSISRINMYQEQPACIVNSHPDLRKYCMCTK